MKRFKFSEEMLTKKSYEQIAERAREIAEKTKHLVGKDTLIIYLDVSGRLTRTPLEQAWRELGVKIPKTRYFFNFSVYKGKGRMTKEQREALRKIISKNKKAKNILIIDTVSYRGLSLGMAKKEINKIIREEGMKSKPVTVSMLDVKGCVKKPMGSPDYSHSKEFSVKEGDVMAVLDYQMTPVTTKEGRTVRDKEGLKSYSEFVRKIKETMKRTRRRRR